MQPRTRALIIALVVSQLALMVPWLVFGGPSGSTYASAALLAAISVIIALVTGSPQLAAIVVPVLAVLSGLAVLWADAPLLAALLVGAAAFTRGLLSSRGLHNALTLSVISVVFLVAQPPTAPDSSWSPPAFATGVVVLASGAWPLLLLWLTRKHLPVLPRHPVDSQHAMWFALVTGIIAGVATGVVSAAHLEHAGGWFVMTILIVMQPFAKDSFRKSAQRGGGTALGFVGAFVIGGLIDGTAYQTAAASVIGGAALLMAVYLILTKKAYWKYAIFLTLAVVMLEGATTSIVRTDVLRLLATLGGVAIAVAITTLLVPLSKVLEKRRADMASLK